MINLWEKLHFTTLNYTLFYTYHPKLWEWTLTPLNYYECNTLHPTIHLSIKFDRKPSQRPKYPCHSQSRSSLVSPILFHQLKKKKKLTEEDKKIQTKIWNNQNL